MTRERRSPHEVHCNHAETAGSSVLHHRTPGNSQPTRITLELDDRDTNRSQRCFNDVEDPHTGNSTSPVAHRLIMGYLIPPWWHSDPTPPWVLEVVAIMLGFFMGSALFAGLKAAKQTYWIWLRLKGRLPSYIIMVWMSWSCGVTQSSINYAYLMGKIEPSFWIFFFQVLIWYIQIQTLMLIMVNRVSLIMYNPVNEKRLKIFIIFIITLLNVGVMVAWVPAQLQISQRFISANQVWHRIEKSTFTIVDAGLNGLFIHLVRTKLVNPGLTRYRHLFRFNIAMVVVSISLDITVIGIVSIGYPEIYVQFRALSAMLKLHIEMTIADFIGKIIKASRDDRSADLGYIPDMEPANTRTDRAWHTSSHHTSSISGPHSEHLTTIEASRVPTSPSSVYNQHGRTLEVSREEELDQQSRFAQRRWSWVKKMSSRTSSV